MTCSGLAPSHPAVAWRAPPRQSRSSVRRGYYFLLKGRHSERLMPEGVGVSSYTSLWHKQCGGITSRSQPPNWSDTRSDLELKPLPPRCRVYRLLAEGGISVRLLPSDTPERDCVLFVALSILVWRFNITPIVGLRDHNTRLPLCLCHREQPWWGSESCQERFNRAALETL